MTGFALGYCRQSSLCQLESQQAFIEDYCRGERLQLAGVFADEAGAADVPLSERPAGQLLFQHLCPGCQVIAHELSLAFSSIGHFLATMKTWLPSEITLHLLRAPNRPLVFSPILIGVTPDDFVVLMETAFKACAALTHALRSETTRQALNKLKVSGRRYTAYPGYGYKWLGRKGKQMRVPDLEETKTIGFLRQKSNQGFSLTQLKQELLTKGIKTSDGRQWSRSRIYRAIRANVDFSITSAGACD
jgi:DNA invertase Pin-like site-specific DNA recombinase